MSAAQALLHTFIARRGITGTLGVFEGPFGLEWIKRDNAEFQSQTCVEAAIELHHRIADPGRIR